MPQSKRDIAIVLSKKSLSLKDPKNRQKLDELLVDALNKNRFKRPEDRRDKVIPIDSKIREYGITILDNDRSRESVKKRIQELQSMKNIKQSKNQLPSLFG